MNNGQSNTFSFEHWFHFFTFAYPEIVSIKVDQVGIKNETGEEKQKRICWGGYNLSVAYKNNREQSGLCQVKMFSKYFCFIPEADNADDASTWNYFEHLPKVNAHIKPLFGLHATPLFRWIPYKVIIVVKWTIHAKQVERIEGKAENMLEESPKIDNKEDDTQEAKGCLQCNRRAEKREERVNPGFVPEMPLVNPLERKRRYPDPSYNKAYRLFYEELKKYRENQPGFRKYE